jgi:hypothetical protein
MFKYFVDRYNPNEVKSFLDRRWGVDGDNLYTKLGFNLEDALAPNYSYTDSVNRFHKFGFRKEALHNKYGFPMTMTESEMTSALGYVKIWDCGLYKYVWRREVKKS